MASAERIDISVLVPILNESANIIRAIQGMKAQSFGGTVEFLLLDAGSTDTTVDRVNETISGDERFRLIRRPGLNIPQLLNLGLRLASGELIARMDAHAVFPPAYLASGAERLVRRDVDSVSGPQVAWGKRRWERRIALALRSRLGRGGADFRHVSPREIEVASGYCGIWRRSRLTELGGWNEAASVGEDVELAARITQSGGRIVCLPQMAAQYVPRGSLRRLARQYSRYGYYRAWLVRRHPSALRRSQLLPAALTLTAFCSFATRGRLAKIARQGMTLYGGVLIAESSRVAKEQPAGDVVSLPAVFATMHLAWGIGFLTGCVVHGPPWSAFELQLHPRPARTALRVSHKMRASRRGPRCLT